LEQNRAPARFSAPQVAQVCMAASVSAASTVSGRGLKSHPVDSR
jgi:hypothetical protein